MLYVLYWFNDDIYVVFRIWSIKLVKFLIFFFWIVLVVINLVDGNFNILGKGINGEGIFLIVNGMLEINFYMVVGEMV